MSSKKICLYNIDNLSKYLSIKYNIPNVIAKLIAKYYYEIIYSNKYNYIIKNLLDNKNTIINFYILNYHSQYYIKIFTNKYLFFQSIYKNNILKTKIDFLLNKNFKLNINSLTGDYDIYLSDKNSLIKHKYKESQDKMFICDLFTGHGDADETHVLKKYIEKIFFNILKIKCHIPYIVYYICTEFNTNYFYKSYSYYYHKNKNLKYNLDNEDQIDIEVLTDPYRFI